MNTQRFSFRPTSAYRTFSFSKRFIGDTFCWQEISRSYRCDAHQDINHMMER